MSHSVAQHLHLEIDNYDASIRQFIVGYEAMLDAAVTAIMSAGDLTRVVDLGAGTGALSSRLLERHTGVVVELWDIDPQMLAKARERLAPFGERAVFRDRSYEEPIDHVDGVMASLALHHLRELETKRKVYCSIASGLRSGGVFANADITIPDDQKAGKAEYQAWADHQVAFDIGEEQAWRHFEEWSGEDRYFSLEVETASLEQAGLEPSCPWRDAPSTVLVGTKRS